MSGLFNTLSTATKGLMAQQTALHTTGHNLSNANTEGFSRQRVELKADLAFSAGGMGQLGTGVKIDSVIRIVNDYVSKQIRQENGTQQRFLSKYEVMEQMEGIFNEPSDTGLNKNLGNMFDSWVELSKNPEMLTSKTQVVERSKTLADTFNRMMKQIDSLETETNGLIDKNIQDFNSILNKLEALNTQIFNVSVKGSSPNDLLDSRDLYLKDLTSIMDVDIETDKYGRVSIAIEGRDDLLVAGKSVKQLERADIIEESTGEAKNITSGEIMGRIDALGELEARKEELEIFAETFKEAMNTVHKIDNDDAEDIFIYLDGKLSVNEVLDEDPSLLQAGKKDGAEGDGSIALLMSRLRDVNIKFSDSPSFDSDFIDLDKLTFKGQEGGNTIGGYYNNIVTSVGISIEHAESMVKNQEILLGQLDLRRESVSGVSIDEEVTNLLKFSSAYDANARVIQTLADMLDTLINRTGV